MDALNRIAAPEWFTEALDAASKAWKEAEKLLDEKMVKKLKAISKEGVSEEQAMGEIIKVIGDLVSKNSLPSEDIRHKMMIIYGYVDSLKSGAWARFRYENMDTQFSTANLEYDRDGKYIELVKK